jgi:predicted RNase H-like HicB family nuclease
MIRYPVAIEVGNEKTAHGVVIPDLPGCFSAGDTLDEAFSNAEEAVAAWIDAALDAGEAVPAPSALSDVRARPDFAGWVFGFVQVDPAALDDTVDRVNITLPRRVLARLDALAKVKGVSRSGYIAHLTTVARDAEAI